LHHLKRYQEALNAYDRTLALDSNLVGTWRNRGSALYMLHRYEEALTNYERALVLDSTMKGAWEGKAMTLRQLGRTAEAEAIEQQANNSTWNPDSLRIRY
jgi:tetratricopeptide (TPR) repeat protein